MFKALKLRWHCENLRSEDSSRRSAAAEALGKMGDPRAIEPLIKALESWRGKAHGIKHDERIRCAAAWALGHVGDGRAVEPLVSALEDTSGNVRRAAGEALRMLAMRAPLLLLSRWDHVASKVRGPHQDGPHEDGAASARNCSYDHTDQGIGLEFPDPPAQPPCGSDVPRDF